MNDSDINAINLKGTISHHCPDGDKKVDHHGFCDFDSVNHFE